MCSIEFKIVEKISLEFCYPKISKFFRKKLIEVKDIFIDSCHVNFELIMEEQYNRWFRNCCL